MTSPYAALRQIVIPIDEFDRAYFKRQAAIGRVAIGCFGCALAGFFLLFGSLVSASDGAGLAMLVAMALAACAILGTAWFLLRPAAMEGHATKIVYRGVVSATRTDVAYVHAHTPHSADPATPTQTTVHYAALDGVEFTLTPSLYASVVVGGAYDFHALREGDVFRITPTPV